MLAVIQRRIIEWVKRSFLKGLIFVAEYLLLLGIALLLVTLLPLLAPCLRDRPLMDILLRVKCLHRLSQHSTIKRRREQILLIKIFDLIRRWCELLAWCLHLLWYEWLSSKLSLQKLLILIVQGIHGGGRSFHCYRPWLNWLERRSPLQLAFLLIWAARENFFQIQLLWLLWSWTLTVFLWRRIVYIFVVLDLSSFFLFDFILVLLNDVANFVHKCFDKWIILLLWHLLLSCWLSFIFHN